MSCYTDFVVEDVPKSFPFKIENKPQEQTVTLTKNDNGENIAVVVQMPAVLSLGCNRSPILMVVRVTKHFLGTTLFGYMFGGRMEFHVSAYPDKIEITTLSTVSGEEEIADRTQNVRELDENLRKALHRYLDIRGINTELTNFLHEYIKNKDNREYVEWLKEIKKRVKDE